MSAATRLLCCALLLLGILVAACPSAAADRIALSVDPQHGFAPLTATFTLRIVKDARNVSVCLQFESSDYERKSCWAHAGSGAPSVTKQTYRGIPAGVYTATAELLVMTAEQTIASIHATPVHFTVLESDPRV
jgi:hypothetical protein